MNKFEGTILPRLTPVTWLYSAGLLYISCICLSIWFITQQPYLGIKLTESNIGKMLTVSAIYSKTAAEKLNISDKVSEITASGFDSQKLSALSIMEEPDNFKTYLPYNQFVEHHQKLYKILSQSVIYLKLADGRQISISPLNSRPISHLPFQFWALIIIAGIGFYIGLWIWIFRRGKIEARLIAISGLGFMVGACCLAIYSNRELTINPEHYAFLASLNHLGNITFAYSSLILLYYYPSKISNFPFALIGYFALALVWLNETLQWLEIPFHTFYFLPYIASSAVGFLFGRWQWLRHKHNPVARASIRWFLLTLTLCIGCALALYFIPTMFNETPLLPVWLAQLIILSLYVGLVLGVIQYRLFDIEKWWFNCWSWFLSGCLVIALDLLLIYLFSIHPLNSLSIAILITTWCYFPLRHWFWVNTVHPHCSRIEEFFPLLTQSYISSPSIQHFEDSWSDILHKIYKPLSLQLSPHPVESVSISNHGLSIILPALNNEQHIIVSGMEKGGKLFSTHDVRFIESALDYARNCISWKTYREEGANQERDRITRDLHDDVGALLLTLIHKAESAENALLAKNALNGVRNTIYSLRNDSYMPFNTILSNWREEIKQRTDAAKVSLLWKVDTMDKSYYLSPRQRINLDRIIRESITNILKHALPQCIDIYITETNNKTQLIIIDDGDSPDSSTWQANTGLYNLNNRASEINASINWSSLHASPSLKTGTKLTITLPKMENKPYALSPDS